MHKIVAAPVSIEWHCRLPIYASEKFLKSESRRFGWIGGIDDQAGLVCVLPYTITEKPGLHMVRFRTATIPLMGEIGLQEEKTFLNAVVEYFRSAGADIIIPSGNTAVFRTYPDGAEVAPYGTFINDLSESEGVLMGRIRKTYRQNIRKAVAAGVQIKCGVEYLETSYDLIADTMSRSGSSFKSLSDFSARVAAFGDYVKVFIAEHEGSVQGCMVAPFSSHAGYNCYAGSKREPVLGAMHLLHWEAMRQFRAMGVQRFDFQGVRMNPEQGSKQAGIFTYKQGFGGNPVQGYMWKYSLRRVTSLAYRVAARLLMGGDIVDQEQRRLRGVVRTAEG